MSFEKAVFDEMRNRRKDLSVSDDADDGSAGGFLVPEHYNPILLRSPLWNGRDLASLEEPTADTFWRTGNE